MEINPINHMSPGGGSKGVNERDLQPTEALKTFWSPPEDKVSFSSDGKGIGALLGLSDIAK